ncbi:MAG TPA: hypothetical protein PLX97_00295, partial [Gemmatales bacterium]|nr:hypothetical protein [Gemmatales bacterium]
DPALPLSDIYRLDLPLTALAVVVFLGLFYQAMHLSSRKYGSAYFLLALMILIAMPTLAGSMMSSMRGTVYEIVGKGMLYATPVTQVLRVTVPQPDQPFSNITPYYMAAGYAALSLCAWLYTARWLANHRRRVDATKTRMQIVSSQALSPA